MPSGAPPPPCVAGLARLQRACFHADVRLAGSAADLPDGPWAGSLRQLGTSYEVLLRSDALLAAATQLEQLHVMKAGWLLGTWTPACLAFWEWCRRHPLLQQLHIRLAPFDTVPGAFVAALNQLRNERPALQVQLHEFDTPMCSSLFHHV